MLLRRVTQQSDLTQTTMRNLLACLTVLGLLTVIYCVETEEKDFVVVVKDNNEQNVTTTTEKTVKPIVKNLVISRLKSKKDELKNKFIKKTHSKNETMPKIMYKFEAKDGRMKFQRDVEDYKSTETQTESYEPIEYEPVKEKSPEIPSLSYYQPPVMFYTLCPVYPDQLSNYQIYDSVNINRNPKQLPQYMPVSNSFTNYVPNNYYSGTGQHHQYTNQQQFFGNDVKYNTQNANHGYNNYNTKFHNNGFKHMYTNTQNNHITNNLNKSPKFNAAYYADYMNGIDNQVKYYQANQNYVYVPVNDPQSGQNSQYYNTKSTRLSQQSNVNNAGLYQHQNTYYYPHNTHVIHGSYIDPTTGSYQIEVGNKYTDTTSSNKQVLNTNHLDLNDQNNVVSHPIDSSENNINYSQTIVPKKQQGKSYIYTKGNGKVIYYYYDNGVDDINPMFESLKINVAQQ